MPNAGELLNSLQETFGLKKKKPRETMVAAAVPPVVVAEVPAAPETPAATPTPEPMLVSPIEGQLPDWLSAPPGVEPVLATAPEPEAPTVETVVAVEAPGPAQVAASALPAVESQAVVAETKVEVDPFATNREFNGYMETICQAQAVLASGIALTSEEQKKALIAVARSNSLLPKLPPEVLESVLLMRAVAANNPNFGRDDFQMEMLAAVNVIKTGTAVEG